MMKILDEVLGSGTKIRALRVLVLNPTESYYETELANLASVPQSSLHVEIEIWYEIGLVNIIKMGKLNFISIDQTHWLYPILKKLFESEKFAIEKAIQEFVYKIKQELGSDIKKIVIFGSAARKEMRVLSDIDIIIVVSNKANLKIVEDKLAEIRLLFLNKHFWFETIVYSESEFSNESQSLFLRNVRTEGIVYE
ncbi:MAG: nucleotidyltransferase domain-containing protein [Euryarchaeota archaeon]|nr:nucleotidyltransferase domain-containing protein [Euryarchaeota archaeon]